MNLSSIKCSIRHRCRRCFLISTTIIIALALLIVILALTIFRIRDATTTVNSVKLGGLRASLNLLNLSIDINITIDLDLSAHNPNRTSFHYGKGSAELFYCGTQVGEASIPAGEIGAGGSERMNITLTIFTGKLIGDSVVYVDVLEGSIVFQTMTRIPGRVTVLGIFKHHIVTYSSCDVKVNVSSRTVEKSNCRYNAKL